MHEVPSGATPPRELAVKLPLLPYPIAAKIPLLRNSGIAMTSGIFPLDAICRYIGPPTAVPGISMQSTRGTQKQKKQELRRRSN